MAYNQKTRELLVGKQLLIFDFDGTLADTSNIHAEAFSKALSSTGITVDYSTIAGMKTVDAVRKLLTEHGLKLSCKKVDKLTQKKQQYARNLIETTLEPIPGVMEFLAWAEKRFKLALVTSGSKTTVQLALKKLKFENLFEPSIFSEDVNLAKPNPEGFLLAAKYWNINNNHCLVFEDSSAGVEAAKLAKMQVIDVRRKCVWL